MVLRSTASPRTDLASPQHPLWPQIRWWWLLAMVVSTDSVQIDGFYLMKPVIALVGRPNVGKSTLFNRLTKSRDAIVADFAGLTRDRHYGNGKQGKHEYIVIDTGGFEPDASSGIYKEMAKQTQQAVAEADVESDKGIIKLAVAGRPNVGKSTLINTWLGEERLVAFDMPGTTRDAITVPFERNGQRFELVDTAGLRRKGKVFEAIEKFSVVKTLQAIESANVVLLLLDATQGVTDQDAHIAGYILESGRAVVVAVNKWDAVDDYQRQLLERSIETRLAFLKFASLHFISAKKRQGLGPVWASIVQAHKAATCKMSKPVLTRLLLEAVQFQSPKRAGMFRPKM